MKKINQKNSSDCGICCVAMVLDISYNEAMELLKPHMNDENYSLDFNKLEDCLIENGCAIKISEGAPNSKAKNGILEIKLSNENFHYVVWDSKTKSIIDPQEVKAENFIPFRFIEVIKL